MGTTKFQKIFVSSADTKGNPNLVEDMQRQRGVLLDMLLAISLLNIVALSSSDNLIET